MKKLLTIALTVLLSLCMLAGMAACNIDTGDEQSGNTGVSSEENPDAPVELTVGTLATEYEQSLMQEWINQFQRDNPEVSIKITRTFQGMAEIIDMKNMGVLPDIVWTAGDQHSNFSGSDYFYDLSDESRFPGSAEFFSDFYPALITTASGSSPGTTTASWSTSTPPCSSSWASTSRTPTGPGRTSRPSASS